MKPLTTLTCASCGIKDMLISLQTRMYLAQYIFMLLKSSSGQSEKKQSKLCINCQETP